MLPPPRLLTSPEWVRIVDKGVTHSQRTNHWQTARSGAHGRLQPHGVLSAIAVCVQLLKERRERVRFSSNGTNAGGKTFKFGKDVNSMSNGKVGEAHNRARAHAGSPPIRRAQLRGTAGVRVPALTHSLAPFSPPSGSESTQAPTNTVPRKSLTLPGMSSPE